MSLFLGRDIATYHHFYNLQNKILKFIPVLIWNIAYIYFYKLPKIENMSRDSAVGIEIGDGLNDLGVGVRVPVRASFSLLHVVQIGSGAHPASYLMVAGALSPEVKRLGREADHSPPTSAEVKNTWIYTSTPPYAFMA
jgi:hypothetical protein